MTRTLLTGATGTLGTELRPRLEAVGHDVVAASRSPPATDDGSEWVRVDLAEGAGVRRAVADVDVVIHAATAPRGDAEAVDVRGTERLLAAAADAGVANVVYVSIAGVDEIPYSYYRRKVEAERAVADSEVPHTIVRATQFHAFLADLLDLVARLPIWPLPGDVPLQPVAAGDVAAELLEYVDEAPAGRVPDVAGPAVRTVGDLARTYREVRGLRRPIVEIPFPGETASTLRSGAATRPDRAVGTVTWEEWLRSAYD